MYSLDLEFASKIIFVQVAFLAKLLLAALSKGALELFIVVAKQVIVVFAFDHGLESAPAGCETGGTRRANERGLVGNVAKVDWSSLCLCSRDCLSGNTISIFPKVALLVALIPCILTRS